MKAKCMNCGCEFDIRRLEHDENNPEGFYTECTACGASFNLDESEILGKMFITDIPKMADFKVLSQRKFLESYSYLTEDEYDATLLYFRWLTSR